MLYASIGLFALAAVTGITILVGWITGKNASWAVIYSHGILAAIGLTLLIVLGVQNPDRFPQLALILFGVAALGGFYMFFRDLKGKESPWSIAGLHALLAVGGFVALLVFAFG